MVADLLETVGVDRVITMDLHAGQVQGSSGPRRPHGRGADVRPVRPRPARTDVERVAVAPDTGHAKLASKFAEMIGGGLVVLNKERPGHNQARVTGVIGEVEGKIAVMTDDMIDTGDALRGRQALKEAGRPGSTPAPRTAPQRARPRTDRGERARARDRHGHGAGQLPHQAPVNIEVLSISGLLAETIQNVFADDSVSAIFAGENQLF